MIARLLNSLAGRRLAQRANEKSHERIIERAKEMRRQLGLPDDPRLA